MKEKTAEEIMYDALCDMSSGDTYGQYSENELRGKIALTLQQIYELRERNPPPTHFVNKELLLDGEKDFNEFTTKLKEVIDQKGSCFVKLQSGRYEKVFWYKEGDYEYFRSEDHVFIWNKLGYSSKSDNLNLLEFDL